MRPALALVLSLGVSLGGCAAAPHRTTSVSSRNADAPTCVTWHKEARYRPYGYDHLVYIFDGCTKTARCVVTTDVNPSPITAVVPPGTEVEVVTFVGSPASTFEAYVACELID